MPRLAGFFTNPSHPPRAQKYPSRLPYCYETARGISVDVRINIPSARHSRDEHGMQEEFWDGLSRAARKPSFINPTFMNRFPEHMAQRIDGPGNVMQRRGSPCRRADTSAQHRLIDFAACSGRTVGAAAERRRSSVTPHVWACRSGGFGETAAGSRRGLPASYNSASPKVGCNYSVSKCCKPAESSSNP